MDREKERERERKLHVQGDVRWSIGSCPYAKVYSRHLRPVLTPRWRDETPNGTRVRAV